MIPREIELQKKLDRANNFLLQDTEFKTLYEQLGAVKVAAETGFVDPRLRALGLAESLDGSLVQADFSYKLFSPPGIAEVWNRIFKIKLGELFFGIDLPQFDESSRGIEDMLGGIEWYWIEESTELPATKPKFRSIQLRLKKCAWLGYLTDEFSQDSEAGGTVIPAAAQISLNRLIYEMVTDGTGAGRPLGILQSGATVTVQKEVGQDPATILGDNVLKMITHLPAESWQSPGLCWLIHKDAIPQLSTATVSIGTGGGHLPLWHWREAGAKFNQLAGIDVLINLAGKPLGTRGDIILCDLNQYCCIYKEVKKTVSLHVKFLTDQEAFRFVMRWDAAPAWSKAVTAESGDNLISPFITLESR